MSVRSPIESYLARLHERHAATRQGEVATYIPELAKADPDWFGICIATTDGKVYEVGDSRQPFTIQSISKPFSYGLALEDCGRDAVLEKVGVEPSGDAFNSISLAPDSGRPLNPMINAGAIAATSLVAGHSDPDRFERLLALFSLFAGRSLEIDEGVYSSEKQTGHRNRAIAHMLRNFEVLGGDPEQPLDTYFRQCSISVNCRDLSLMAATLANGGSNPATGERAIRAEFVESVLSVMATCGMYDFAGEWVYRVGMPAKSGVAGGILAVLPGQLGIGVFSPPLDPRGNSVRGVAVCQELSRDFRLHFLRAPRTSRSAIRARYNLSSIGSKRVRSDAERRTLDAQGRRAQVYDLQGDLAFAAVEAVVRIVVEESPHLDFALLDLKRVTLIDESAAQALLDLLLSLAGAGKQLLLVNVQQHSRFIRFLEERLSADPVARLLTFAEMDLALEYCEDRLLGVQRRRKAVPDGPTLPLAAHAICRGLTLEQVALLEARVERRCYAAGERIVREGEPATQMFFIARGEVSVTIDLPNGQLRRLSTLSPGMTFGELAVVNRDARSADVRADQPVECFVLPIEAFDRLGGEHPAIKTTLLENLLRTLGEIVSRLTREVATLAG